MAVTPTDKLDSACVVTGQSNTPVHVEPLPAGEAPQAVIPGILQRALSFDAFRPSLQMAVVSGASRIYATESPDGAKTFAGMPMHVTCRLLPFAQCADL